MYLGEVLNQRYVVESKLGWGGFSAVWMAFDKKTRTMVALKISSSGAGDDAIMHDQLSETICENPSPLVLYHDKSTILGETDGNRGPTKSLFFPYVGLTYTTHAKVCSPHRRMSTAEQVLDISCKLHSRGVSSLWCVRLSLLTYPGTDSLRFMNTPLRGDMSSRASPMSCASPTRIGSLEKVSSLSSFYRAWSV